MSSSNAEDSSLISDYGPAELRNVEIILQKNLMRQHLVYIVEVDVLSSPFKVVDEFARAVTFLQDEGVLE